MVTLYDAVSNTIVATTTTDMHGRYLFDELLPEATLSNSQCQQAIRSAHVMW